MHLEVKRVLDDRQGLDLAKHGLASNNSETNRTFDAWQGNACDVVVTTHG